MRHTSDCAVHNEPAMPAGPCDCGAAEQTVAAVHQAVADCVHIMGRLPPPLHSMAIRMLDGELLLRSEANRSFG